MTFNEGMQVWSITWLFFLAPWFFRCFLMTLNILKTPSPKASWPWSSTPHSHRVTSATHQVAHVETLAKAANPTRNTATQVFEDTGNVQPGRLKPIADSEISINIRFPGRLPPKGWRYSPKNSHFPKNNGNFFGILRWKGCLPKDLFKLLLRRMLATFTSDKSV